MTASLNNVVIGWYVHSQGLGHGTRFVTVARRIRELSPSTAVVGLGSLRPDTWHGDWIDLPRDDIPQPDDAADVQASGALHYAPLGHDGFQARSVITADWLRKAKCSLFVVDVSVEMLLLGRLCSVPTVTVGMRGSREDRPHSLGFDVATAILAPWPPETQHPGRDFHLDKTIAVGAFSRFDERIRDTGAPVASEGVLLLTLGFGGHEISSADVAEAMAATPSWQWHIVGSDTDPWGISWPAAATVYGCLTDPWPTLIHADVVIGPCSDGTLSEVAAARKPFIALPQARPHDEQMIQARILQDHGLAEVAWSWPAASDWSGLIDRVRKRAGDRWRWFNDGQGAIRAARALLNLAAGPHRSFHLDQDGIEATRYPPEALGGSSGPPASCCQGGPLPPLDAMPRSLSCSCGWLGVQSADGDCGRCGVAGAGRFVVLGPCPLILDMLNPATAGEAR